MNKRSELINSTIWIIKDHGTDSRDHVLRLHKNEKLSLAESQSIILECGRRFSDEYKEMKKRGKKADKTGIEVSASIYSHSLDPDWTCHFPKPKAHETVYIDDEKTFTTN